MSDFTDGWSPIFSVTVALVPSAAISVEKLHQRHATRNLSGLDPWNGRNRLAVSERAYSFKVKSTDRITRTVITERFKLTKCYGIAVQEINIWCIALPHQQDAGVDVNFIRLKRLVWKMNEWQSKL